MFDFLLPAGFATVATAYGLSQQVREMAPLVRRASPPTVEELLAIAEEGGAMPSLQFSHDDGLSAADVEDLLAQHDYNRACEEIDVLGFGADRRAS